MQEINEDEDDIELFYAQQQPVYPVMEPGMQQPMYQ